MVGQGAQNFNYSINYIFDNSDICLDSMDNIDYLLYHILFGALFIVLICLKCDIKRFLGSLNLIIGPTNLERLNKL